MPVDHWPFATRLAMVVAPKTECPWKMTPVLLGETGAVISHYCSLPQFPYLFQ